MTRRRCGEDKFPGINFLIDRQQSAEFPNVSETPTAHYVPQATSFGTIADGWLSSAIARIADLTTHAALTTGVHGVGSSYVAKTSRSDQWPDWSDIQSKPASFTPSAHAASHATSGSDPLAPEDIGAAAETHAAQHKHGGGDEVATATPAANAIPKAGAGGTIAAGWLPTTAVSAGSYGSASQVGMFTVDAAGRLTAAANVAIALAASAITSGEIPRSPLTTRGDILTQNPSGTHTRLGIGAVGRYMRSDGTDPGWSLLDMGDAAAGTLAAARGGTGLSSYAIGDLLYASGSSALSKLADVATGDALISGGVGVAPSWGKIGLTTHVSGVLGGSNGGSGVDNGSFTLTWLASGTAVLRASAATAGQVGFWSSAYELSHDDDLVWDSTNIRLTIGQPATPAGRLHISGGKLIIGESLSSVTNALVLGKSDASSEVIIGQSGTARFQFAWFYNATESSAYAQLGSVGAQDMLLVTNATERMRFVSDGNIGLWGASFGGGTKVLFIGNRSAAPSSNPSGGGILYCESGALKYRGSSGTVTTLAAA